MHSEQDFHKAELLPLKQNTAKHPPSKEMVCFYAQCDPQIPLMQWTVLGPHVKCIS